MDNTWTARPAPPFVSEDSHERLQTWFWLVWTSQRKTAAGGDMKLIKAETWARRYFGEGDRPDLRTVRGWIRDGYVPGREMGPKLVYVDEDAWLKQRTGNELADRVLYGSARATP